MTWKWIAESNLVNKVPILFLIPPAFHFNSSCICPILSLPHSLHLYRCSISISTHIPGLGNKMVELTDSFYSNSSERGRGLSQVTQCKRTPSKKYTSPARYRAPWWKTHILVHTVSHQLWALLTLTSKDIYCLVARLEFWPTPNL